MQEFRTRRVVAMSIKEQGGEIVDQLLLLVDAGPQLWPWFSVATGHQSLKLKRGRKEGWRMRENRSRGHGWTNVWQMQGRPRRCYGCKLTDELLFPSFGINKSQAKNR